ncbi:MAG TPA: ester cyclase [Polyangiaceae bacterium]|nr:ester cyclase [Polyangiaceae bacterium]
MTNDERNERTLREFYRLFYNEKRFDEGAALLAEGFINHHGGARNVGRPAMVDEFGRLARTAFPDFHLEVRRLIARDDFVWTHGLVTGLPEGRRAVTVDIWRFERGAIAEHWDVGQALGPGQDPGALLD